VSVDPDRAQYEAQKAEFEAEEREALGKGHCPASGLPLSPPFTDAWGRTTRACGVCDCFGYAPEEVGQP
jgi:hypothetical protein